MPSSSSLEEVVSTVVLCERPKSWTLKSVVLADFSFLLAALSVGRGVHGRHHAAAGVMGFLDPSFILGRGLHDLGSDPCSW